MSNHYHVCLRTPKGNLSRVMRHVDGLHTQRFNRSHRRDGCVGKSHSKSSRKEDTEIAFDCPKGLTEQAVAKVWEQTIGFGRLPLSGDVLYPKQMGRERTFFEGIIKFRVGRGKERLLDCCCGEVETVVDCTMRATRDFQS
jgi:hypothetical protein